MSTVNRVPPEDGDRSAHRSLSAIAEACNSLEGTGRRAWRRFNLDARAGCRVVLTSADGARLRCRRLVDVSLGGIGVVVQKCGVIVGMGDLLEVELHLSGGPVLLQGVVVRVSPDLEKDQRVGLSFIRGVLYESAYVPMAMYLVELDRRGAGSSPMGAPAGRAAAGLIAGLAKRRL